jgi:hypothetical protein
MNAYKVVIKKDKMVEVCKKGKGKSTRWVPIIVTSIDYIKMSPEKDSAEIGFWGVETK